MGGDTEDASVSDTDWRGWLEFQLQFKRNSTFVDMERTGDAPWRVLDALRARLRSPHDVAVVDETVERYRKSGGSARGSIYKALEALTQRHCPRGTRQKLQDEMDALRKHHETSVETYTVSFHHLLDMYTSLSLQDGTTLTTADVCRLYSSGMPQPWQDRVEQERESYVTVSELEIRYKRCEREEREDDEYQSAARKRRRPDDGQDHCASPRPYDRRPFESGGCSYCREYCYGHIYKTHTDAQCYRNPKNKQGNATYVHRFVPRGKCIAVFGPVSDKTEAETTPPSAATLEPAVGQESVQVEKKERETDNVILEQTTNMSQETSLNDIAPVCPVVKDEPIDAGNTSADQPPEVEPPKSAAVSTPIKCDSAIPVETESTSTVKPWEEIVLAMVGPFGQTDWSVLVFVDTATQFVELYPVVDATSEEITRAIDHEWLSRYPWPARFVYSARVPAYDAAFSHLAKRGSGGKLPVAEPAPPTVLGVLLLHVHLVLEMKVIEMQPQSQSDWMNVVCVARHELRVANNAASVAPTDSHSTTSTVDSPTSKDMKPDPLSQPAAAPAVGEETPTWGMNSPSCHDFVHAFAPDDMVLVEYRELRRCVGSTPRREGPYRVEAVRSNGILVIDKGKYLEQIHARRAVRADVY